MGDGVRLFVAAVVLSPGFGNSISFERRLLVIPHAATRSGTQGQTHVVSKFGARSPIAHAPPEAARSNSPQLGFVIPWVPGASLRDAPE